jgi:hypothetical protein
VLFHDVVIMYKYDIVHKKCLKFLLLSPKYVVNSW